MRASPPETYSGWLDSTCSEIFDAAGGWSAAGAVADGMNAMPPPPPLPPPHAAITMAPAAQALICFQELMWMSPRLFF